MKHYSAPVSQPVSILFVIDRKNTIWTKLWKTSMERQPRGTNGDSKSRRIFYKNTEKLGTDDKGNGGSLEKHEEAIW